MNSAFDMISRYFWLFGLGFSYYSYVSARRELATTDGPSATDGTEPLGYLRTFGIAGALPWLVMGWGQFTGIAPSVWYYFRPQDMNPFVLAWFALIFLTSVTFAIWVLFLGGAEIVQKYNLLSDVLMRGMTFPSVRLIKLYAAAVPFFVLLIVYLAIDMDAKIPGSG